MSNLKRQLTVAAVSVTAAVSFISAEAASFKTPKNYSIIIADGEKTSGFFTEKREMELEPGRHQIVVFFKGSFKKGHDKIIASAVNPLVINIPNVKESDNFSFSYPRITSYEQAQDYADKQNITITNNGTPVSNEEASYIILKSDKGFQLDRDFMEELRSLDLLYVSDANARKLQKNAQDLTNCRDSVTNCPKEVVANSSNKSAVSAVNAADAVTGASAKAETKNTVANAQMLEGLKSIYQSADPATRAAFKEWLKNN